MEQLQMEWLLAEDRRWSYTDWERRFPRHPLTGSLTRRLLWQCEVAGTWVTGVPANRSGSLVAVDGTPLPIDRGSQVRLWHPLRVEPAELARWRRQLPEHRFRQPFPQIFRRVYVAASAHGTHPFLSDRLAGYLLPRDGAVRWLHTRGWRSGLLNLRWISRLDRELDGTGFRAELFLTPVWDHRSVGSLRTPTVRFRRWEGGDRNQVVDLVTVPPLVYSEALYDIGLLVETHAVGFDPRWRDDCVTPSPTQTRVRLERDVLLRVLAALGIADRCTVSDQFLGVRGELRSYRINLDTGEVVMKPGKRSLCLVPAPSVELSPDILPFREQDYVLSLVVSKAVLLVNDARIRDPSIVRQLGSFG